MRVVDYAVNAEHPSPSSSSQSAAPLGDYLSSPTRGEVKAADGETARVLSGFCSAGDAWTDGDITRAARLWNEEKLTASGIGERMGRSRSSVCGMISRNRARFSERNGTSGTGRWTQDMLDTARRLHAAGVTQREIAKTVGVSLDRLVRVIDGRRDLFPPRETFAVMPDLEALAEAERREAARRARKRDRELAVRRRLATPPARTTDHAPGLEALFARAAAPESGPCGLMALTARRCKWPVGDPLRVEFHFCGAAIERGKIYCPDHRALATEVAR